MFCVVYEFVVKPEMNGQFERSWAEYTDAIYRVRGSLGSRLHKTNIVGKYVAYAQWPSRDIFEGSPQEDKYTDKELGARELMRASVETSTKVYELEMTDNRLKQS